MTGMNPHKACFNMVTKTIFYRSFRIEQFKHQGQLAWDWCHESSRWPAAPIGGTCANLFDCIEAIDRWYVTGARPAEQEHLGTVAVESE